uniref:Ionotropic glutamate receptor C-terminal domain-containing protein n=1 Tax=Anopheles stephensi TaxID=30069 RepID=A0A182Y9J1_ANOST
MFVKLVLPFLGMLLLVHPVPPSVNGIVYVRMKNERGPMAARAGVQCIELLSDTYFHMHESTQIENIVIFYLRNLSSPAREILLGYLQQHHNGYESDDRDRALDGNGSKVSSQFQLKLMSDTVSSGDMRRAQFTDHKQIDYYVIVTDNFEGLRQALARISATATFNPRGKFVVLYNNPNDRDSDRRMANQALMLLFIGHHSVNVLFAFAIDAVSYHVYTGDPYHGTTDCGQMKPLKVATVVNGTFANRALSTAMINIPKVPPELETCTFLLCTRVAPPFIDLDCRRGLELQIMDLLRESMKFKVNVSCSEMDRGELMADGNWSDLLGLMRADECDIIAGGFNPDFDVHDEFGSTTLYLQDYHTWFVPAAGPDARWKLLLYIFEASTWELFACVLVISALVWRSVAHFLPECDAHRELSMCFLNTWCVFLCISANNRPACNSLRLFFMALTLYALNVTTIYTSILITVLTNPPRAYQVDTIEEVLASGVPIGGRLDSEDWFINDFEDDRLVSERYNATSEFQPSLANLQAVVNGSRSLLMSRLYVRNTKYYGLVHGLSKDVFVTQIEMIMEKGFPLLPKFNRILSNLIDMGIMQKLWKDFLYNVTILDRIRQNRNLSEEDIIAASPEVVLTLDHLQSAFALYGIGLCLCVVVFLLELLSKTRWVRQLRAMVERKWDELLVRAQLKERTASEMAIKPRKMVRFRKAVKYSFRLLETSPLSITVTTTCSKKDEPATPGPRWWVLYEGRYIAALANGSQFFRSCVQRGVYQVVVDTSGYPMAGGCTYRLGYNRKGVEEFRSWPFRNLSAPSRIKVQQQRRRYVVLIKWEKSKLDIHVMNYCLAVSTDRRQRTLCQALGNSIHRPSCDTIAVNDFLHRLTPRDERKLDADVDTTIVCTGTRTRQLIRGMKPNVTYFVDVFAIHSQHNNISFLLGSTQVQLNRTRPTQLVEGKVAVGKLSTLGGISLFNFKVPKRSPNNFFKLHLTPCGGTVSLEVLKKKRRIMEPVRDVYYPRTITVRNVRPGERYLIRVHEADDTSRLNRIQVAVSSREDFLDLPRMPLNTTITELVPLRKCHSSTIAWFGSPDKDVTYCVYVFKLPKTQYYINNVKIPTYCELESRDVCNHPQFHNKHCFNRVQYNPLSLDINNLLPEHYYTVFVTANSVRGRSLPYKSVRIKTAPYCLESNQILPTGPIGAGKGPIKTVGFRKAGGQKRRNTATATKNSLSERGTLKRSRKQQASPNRNV